MYCNGFPNSVNLEIKMAKPNPMRRFLCVLLFTAIRLGYQNSGDETYERILHRYHELNFHITESAAYDLIGDSIVPRPGMETQWEEVKRI